MSQCSACNRSSSKSKQKAFREHFGYCQTTAILRNRTKGIEYRPSEGTPCDICAKPMNYIRGASLMCFDHDPETHRFRGWICQQCNTGLGKLGDTITGVQRALDYLTKT